MKKRSARKKSNAVKSTFSQFKATIDTKLGKINWKKVGIISFMILLGVALTGALGPHARILAKTIVKYSVMHE